jgi:uncharacterized glyoxalase superfamily protein PhnB
MRYRDLAAAVDWLCEAFGFEKQAAVSDADGIPFYAQLAYGNSMIMLGSVRETDLDKLMRQPDEVGGVETQSCYVVVEDADAHYARATAAGAEVLLELRSDGFGRRGYSCRDPEGHIWNFGTYSPWKGRPAPEDGEEEIGAPRATRRLLVAAAVLATIIVGGGLWLMSAPGTSDRSVTTGGLGEAARPDSAALEAAKSELVRVRILKGTAERAAEAAREELSRERNAKETAERAADAVREELARERAAKEAAERAAPAPGDLARERAAKEAAEATATKLEGELTEARNARDEAVRAAEAAKTELAQERAARVNAVQAAEVARADSEKERLAKEDLERTLRTAQEQAALRQPSGIETAATERGAQAGSRPPAQTTWSVASEGAQDQRASPAPRKYARAVRKRKLLFPTDLRRLPPTYLTGLWEVPWPYNIWYGKTTP